MADLKAKEEGKEKVFEKLKKDSEVRWHRDKYKQILNNYDVYYKNIAKLDKRKRTEDSWTWTDTCNNGELKLKLQNVLFILQNFTDMKQKFIKKKS